MNKFYFIILIILFFFLFVLEMPRGIYKKYYIDSNYAIPKSTRYREKAKLAAKLACANQFNAIKNLQQVN